MNLDSSGVVQAHDGLSGDLLESGTPCRDGFSANQTVSLTLLSQEASEDKPGVKKVQPRKGAIIFRNFRIKYR